MVILDHVTDTQIFHGHTVVGGKQAMAQLVEDIPPLVGDGFVLTLQHHHGLASIRSTLVPPGHTALCHTQPFLRGTVAGRMRHMLAIAGRDEGQQSNIESNFTACGGRRFRANLAGKHGVPLPGFAGESQRLDGLRQPPMPPDSDTAYAGDLEASAINLETVAHFFEAKAPKAIFPFEPGIAGLFPRFHTTKEGLKGFIEVLYYRLQDMAVHRPSKRIAGFIGLHLSQLLILTDSALFIMVGVLTFCKTGIVPTAARFKGTIKPTLLTLRGIKAIDHGFEHRATVLFGQQCSAA
jgi:hypothetical protein